MPVFSNKQPHRVQKDEVSTYYPIFINYNKFIGFETEFIGSSLLANETNAKRRIRVVCEGLSFFNAVSKIAFLCSDSCAAPVNVSKSIFSLECHYP